MDDEWYYCVEHGEVEPALGCPVKDRLGPYATREEAELALERARQRTEQWDKEDEAWESPDA